MAEQSVLVRVQSMMSQFVTCHPTNGMNEVTTIQIVKPILVQIVHIGMTVEIMGGGILHTILVTSILESYQDAWNVDTKRLTWYSSWLNMKRVIACPWLVQ